MPLRALLLAGSCPGSAACPSSCRRRAAVLPPRASTPISHPETLLIQPDGSIRRIERSAILGTKEAIPTARLARHCGGFGTICHDVRDSGNDWNSCWRAFGVESGRPRLRAKIDIHPSLCLAGQPTNHQKQSKQGCIADAGTARRGSKTVPGDIET